MKKLLLLVFGFILFSISTYAANDVVILSSTPSDDNCVTAARFKVTLDYWYGSGSNTDPNGYMIYKIAGSAGKLIYRRDVQFINGKYQFEVNYVMTKSASNFEFRLTHVIGSGGIMATALLKQFGNCIRDGRDSDGDGVPNYRDNCINQAGTSSDGCPVGNPDLEVDFTYSGVYSQCLSCNPNLGAFFNQNKRHLIAGSVGSIKFNRLTIRNTGNIASKPATIRFYGSIDNVYQSGSDNLIKSINIPSRDKNSSYGINTTITGQDFWGCISCDINGNYNILIRIDTDNNNDEGTNGESNNFLAIPIYYSKSATATSLKASIAGAKNVLENQDRYRVEVYDLSGREVLSKDANSRDDENIILDALPNGFYIMKTKDGNRKVYTGKN